MRITTAVLAVTALVATAFATAGCDRHRPTQWPASAAGGACQLLDYDTVAAALGTRFDAAGAGRQEQTLTCALTQDGREFPDLVFVLTPSNADELIFRALLTPSNSTAVAELGLIAYQIRRDNGGDGTGPQVEVGWLANDRRMLQLTYTFPAGTPVADADLALPKLVKLAKTVDGVRP